MYSLLVVDDEKYAVWGITKGISWEDLGIRQVYEAFDSNSALEIMIRENIDVVISDIQMPGQSGLSLLKWIRKNRPDTIVIFLTAHAKFSYAQQALELGTYNYLLKPVNHEVLKDMVRGALEKIRCERESCKLKAIYARHYDVWKKYRPIAIENFWCNILDRNKHLSTEYVRNTLELYEIPLKINDKIRPVLVSIEGFDEQANGKEEEILIHAISEYISGTLFPNEQGTFVHCSNNTLILIYGEAIPLEKLKEQLSAISKKCSNDFLCTISFYLGDCVSFNQLADEYEYLLLREQNNTEQKQAIYLKDCDSIKPDTLLKMPNLHDCFWMLNTGKKKEFIEKLEAIFANLKSMATIDYYYTQEICIGLKYLFLSASRNNGFKINFMPFPNCTNMGIFIERLQIWAIKTANSYFTAFLATERTKPDIVYKIEQYVRKHISEDFKRDDIAKALYYNPAYLSRMFKAKTGFSLNEFVSKIRLDEAKKLLETTELTIGDVASRTGFTNFSYFAKQFREAYGITPSEYRKNMPVISGALNKVV